MFKALNPRATARNLFLVLSLFVISKASHADRMDDFEFTILIPYTLGEKIDFDGGASVDTHDDPGLGFTLGYNYSEKMAFRGSLSWNSVSYDATRVLDDGFGTTQSLSGKLDVFAASFGNDFYLTTGKVAPYLNVNLGYANIDSNISDGGAATVCWWDPWWGYICNTFISTYNENYWYYGAGAGLRFDLSRNNFIRVSYNKRWLDFDNASGSDIDSINFEFGFSY